MGYVDLETPEELVPQITDMLSSAKDSGKIKKGINETTKSVERKSAQFVVIASDVTPEEIVVHIPMLCKDKGVPYAFLPTKKDLGVSIGMDVGTSAVAIENGGSAAEKLQDIIKKLPKAEKKEESDAK
jgi:large subunit ribosomal protein L7Ae